GTPSGLLGSSCSVESQVLCLYFAGSGSRVRANTVQLDNDGLFGAAVWLGPVAVAGAFDVPAGVLGLTKRGLARGRLRGRGRRTSSPIACRQRRGTTSGVGGGKRAVLGGGDGE